MTADMTITPAALADLPAILALQCLAYQQEAVRYPHDTLPPMVEALEELTAFAAQGTLLKAESGGEIVGSVRGVMHEGDCEIGRLIVPPARQRQGIGSALLRAIEAHFPTAARYVLFTGHLSAGNIRLYERVGYRIYARERVSGTLELVWMEKRAAAN
jgi:ribosomal protein S18 acetylase RimI-like enzyme